MTTRRNNNARHLSDTALILLGRAADSENLMILPIPKSVKARGMALERTLRSLLNQGFIEEVPVGPADEAWRSGDDGRFGLRITEPGLRAVGVPALESGLGSEADDHQFSGANIRAATPDPRQQSRQSPAGRPGTKQAKLTNMLNKASGQTIGALVAEVGWQPHTVRAVIAGLRKHGHAVSRTKNDEGQSVYRIEVEQTAIGEDAAPPSSATLPAVLVRDREYLGAITGQLLGPPEHLDGPGSQIRLPESIDRARS